ncbi:MAG: hypothetical protein U0V73_02720 [Acidimicrobiia bacterium]
MSGRWVRMSALPRPPAPPKNGLRVVALLACIASVMAACTLTPPPATTAPTGTTAAPSTTTAPPTTTTASAPAPSASPASMLYDANTTGNWEIYRRFSASSAVTQLTSDRRYDSWWVKASPDRTRILFYRTPAGVHDTDYTKTSLWMANIDGSGLHQVIATGQYGWTMQGHAEWSPDGTQLVMFAVPMGVTVTDANGASPRHVAYGADPSWSPDGRRIVYIDCLDPAAIGCTQDQVRVHIVNADGTNPHTVVATPPSPADPTMSPDGTKIAWESLGTGGLVVDLWVANADGTNPHVLFHDGNINTVPVWSSNQEILFTKDQRIQLGYGLWSIRADGTGLTRIFGGELYNFAELAFPLP